MTPAARIKALIDLLGNIRDSRVPMDTTVGDYMRYRRYIGSKDRAAIAEGIYKIVRAHARLSWYLDQDKREDTPRNRVLVWLAVSEGKMPAYIKDLCDGSKYAPSPLADDELTWLEKQDGAPLDHPDMPVSVRTECPPSYADILQDQFGESFEDEMKAMMMGASLDLRVNTLMADREKVINYLEADGIKTAPTPFSPWGLRVEGKVYLSKSKAFSKGWIDIQDEGSQLIAYICDVKPGMQVLDYCAGAGGKTLGLASAIQKKGRIVAMDIEKRRLERARPRLRRAHVHDNIEIRPLEEPKNRKWLRRQKGTFDVVLTDVPCSGTGTWRRNPDMRWRTYGPPVEELITIQAEILDKIAKVVKPGGRLVYATCSLLPAENEEQIHGFLARHDDFRIMPIAEAWPDEGNCPCDGDFMRLTPYQHKTDAFFASVLIKI